MKNQGDEPVIIRVGIFMTIMVTSHSLKTIKRKDTKQVKKKKGKEWIFHPPPVSSLRLTPNMLLM